MRRKLQGSDEGDRQIVEVRSAVLTDGLAAVEAACAEALTDGVHSAGVVLNILSRTPDALNSCKLYLPASTVARK
jgi:hypothetical protein